MIIQKSNFIVYSKANEAKNAIINEAQKANEYESCKKWDCQNIYTLMVSKQRHALFLISKAIYYYKYEYLNYRKLWISSLQALLF